MIIIYNIGIRLFSVAVAIASLFNRKAKMLRVGRRDTLLSVQERMNAIRSKRGEGVQTTWVHCASLGEFEQGRPIIEKLRARHPREIIVVTFFSPSGFEVRKNFPIADAVFYLPSDTAKNATLIVNAVRPDRAIFVKYEYWHHLLKALSQSGAKIYLISALFQPSMVFFRKHQGKFFRNMLRSFTHLYVQDTSSKKLLQTIGIQNVTVAGDTRFDRVNDIVSAAPELPLVAAFAQGSKVVVCGSTWPEDEKLLAELIDGCEGVKFIFAPHNVSPLNIDNLGKLFSGKRIAYYTQTNARDCSQAEILIIDCVGILSGVYQYGQVGYIGGGFGAGIHNILEAATWGLPVIFGPKYHRFAEAVQMIDIGAAVSISSIDELRESFGKISENVRVLSPLASGYVKSRCGATELIIRDIL